MIQLELRNIFVSLNAGQPMESMQEVEVDMGGIKGDRYHIGSNGLTVGTHSIKQVSGKGRIPNEHRAGTVFSNGDFESSLLSFQEMLSKAGVQTIEFTPAMMRRNFYVVANLGELNNLLASGETLRLNGSELELQPIEKCTPCNLPPTYILDPEKQLKPGVAGYDELKIAQESFKTAFAETAGIRVAVIKPAGVRL